MEKYKVLDTITSDVMFEVYGETLGQLFENAATAMFSVICKLDKVEAKESQKIEMKAENLEDLMIHWLQGLIALVDTDEMFFSKFKVLEVDDEHVIAEVSGEEISPEKGNTVVKAVTYFEYKLEETTEGYKLRFTVDI